MIRVALICSTLLTAQVASSDQPGDGEKPSATAEQGEALATYNRMREKSPDTAAAQWKLGLWCEEHGLKAEAITHFSEVVRLDPKREAAWRKLGFKKSGGQWLTDEQIAEEKEQAKADRIWVPILRKCHKDIHGTNGVKKRDEAQATLDAISDPQAIASVYREFGGGGERDQAIAIQILGQIDKPLSSKVLALMAVYGKTPEVRRRATETLRGRRPEEYLALLVGLMRDPLKYEVKPVGGPGSPGILFVEGERFNVRRFYAPPPPITVVPRPGDVLTYDQFGMPVITRTIGVGGPKVGVPGSKSLVYENDPAVQFSATQNLIEAQRGAVNAKAQLESDVAQIDAINDDLNKFNELVMAVAKDASGKDRGRTPKDWRDALARDNLYAKNPTQDPKKPTFSEVVPLAYNPVFSQLTFATKVVVDT